MPQPEIDDSTRDNWYLSFKTIDLSLKPSPRSYEDYSSIITSVPDDLLAMLSIEEGNIVISMLLENMTQRHAIQYGYSVLVNAFESAKKTLIVKAARMALEKEVQDGDSLQDVSLEAIELERQLATIRDIDCL